MSGHGRPVILHLPEKPSGPHPGDLVWIERIEAIRAELVRRNTHQGYYNGV